MVIRSLPLLTPLYKIRVKLYNMMYKIRVNPYNYRRTHIKVGANL